MIGFNPLKKLREAIDRSEQEEILETELYYVLKKHLKHKSRVSNIKVKPGSTTKLLKKKPSK